MTGAGVLGIEARAFGGIRPMGFVAVAGRFHPRPTDVRRECRLVRLEGRCRRAACRVRIEFCPAFLTCSGRVGPYPMSSADPRLASAIGGPCSGRGASPELLPRVQRRGTLRTDDIDGRSRLGSRSSRAEWGKGSSPRGAIAVARGDGRRAGDARTEAPKGSGGRDPRATDEYLAAVVSSRARHARTMRQAPSCTTSR